MDLAAEIPRNVSAALDEDIGGGDLTAALIPQSYRAHAKLICRTSAVLCGTAWFEACFRTLDADARIAWSACDGAKIDPSQPLCRVDGNARAVLTAERPALNFLQTLSATATATRRFVDAVHGTRAKIMDTRKTLPGLRAAQKYAVKTGGGENQRMGLYDGVLIKENHIALAGGVAAALAHAQAAASNVPVQIEVETLSQLEEALRAGARLVLLDNFALDDLRTAVRTNNGRAELEASGGITLANVRDVAETGVDRISIGSLTKDIAAVDLSLRVDMKCPGSA
ncbi:MAG: carboxylating nicotinate-nucleotide diphosphorylase [Burkholderiales bacterium]